MVLDKEQIENWVGGTQVGGHPRGPWSQTVSGLKFHPQDPDPDNIRLYDIAHQLALVNRFGGATKYPYSVAQHTLLCAALAKRLHPGDHEMYRWALLHDASEYVLGDMVRPVKVLLPEYREIEDRLMGLIATRFGLAPLTPTGHHALKHIDNTACMIEKAALLPYSVTWQAMPPALPGYDAYVQETSWLHISSQLLMKLVEEFND